MLVEVSEKYQEFVSQKTRQSKDASNEKELPASNNDTLLDFAGAVINKNVSAAKNSAVKPNVIDELGDIFSDGSSSNIAAPLKPVSLIQNGKYV